MATSDAGGDGWRGPRLLFMKSRLTNLSKWSELSKELGACGLLARPLEIDDYEKGYLELLEQLTAVGRVSKTEFEIRFDGMRHINESKEHYIIVVIEDKITGKIVGCSTLFIEYKFIHECGVRGRLEDVAVLDSYRGRKVGELVVRLIVELAREPFKCYKITLDCKEDLRKFYAKNCFSYDGNLQLAIRFDT